MAEYDPIQIRRTTDTYPDLFQENYVGASATDTERGWWPDIPAITKTVGTQIVYRYFRVGPYLYFGGSFDAVGGVTRNNAACIDLRTNALTDWDPNLNDIVRAFEYDGTYIYIGGCFTDANNGTTRNRICRVNKRTGVVDAWDPNMNDDVLTIVISGTRVFTCGHFTTVNGGTTRNRAAEFSTSSATVQATFDVDFNNSCLSMSYDEENQIMYFAGFFITADGGTTRNRAASWDTDGDALGSWDPDVNNICSMAKVISADSIWVGGLFTTVNGGASTRNNIAEFNAAGTVTSPQLSLNNTVYEMDTDEDGIGVYIGGTFTSFLGSTRNNVAKLKLSDYTLEPWDPNITGGSVFTVFRMQSTAFVGGSYTTVGGSAQAASYAGKDPLFSDTNSLFISKSTGDDANAGTFASPKQTINSVYETSYSFNDVSGNGNNLTENGTVPALTRNHVALPRVGNFGAGPFTTANNFTVPNAIGTAWGTANALTVECFFWLRDMAGAAMLWEYNTPSGVNRILVNTNGSLSAYINGTAHSTATGLVTANTWYHVAITFDGSTKNIYLDDALVLNQAQVATLSGTTTSHVLGYNAVSTSNAVNGYLDRVRMHDAAKAGGFPTTDTTDILAIYNFETNPPQKDIGYTVVIDDETYRETFETIYPYENYGHKGLFAYYGKSPTLNNGRGAVAGTYGARRTGRTKFSTGAGGTFYYVAKNGDDSTGTRGNSALPFLTIQGVLSDGSRLADDTVQIQDDGLYEEDLDAAALAVTIQAKDGKMPTLKGVGKASADTILKINSGFTLSVYGITFVGDASAASTSMITVNLNSALNLYDCTFISGKGVTSRTGSLVAGKMQTIKNCIFSRQTAGLLSVGGGTPGATTIDNCLFDSPKPSTLSTTPVLITAGGTPSATTDEGFYVYNSTFVGHIHPAIRYQPDVNNENEYVVKNCIFDSSGFGSEAILVRPQNSGAVGFFNIENCEIKNYTGDGIDFDDTGFAADLDFTVKNCVIRDCVSGISFVGASTATNTARFEHCTVFDTSNDGISSTFPSANDLLIFNCAVVNSGAIGYDLGVSGSFFQNHGLIEKSSTTAGISLSTAKDIFYSVIEQGATGSAALDATSIEADPLIVDSSVGNVNSAISANSDGILNGRNDLVNNAGPLQGVIVITQNNFIVNGLTIRGDKNFGGGIYVDTLASGAMAKYVTLDGLGPYGIFSAGTSTVNKCLFKDLKGLAFVSGGVGNVISFCAVSSCQGGGVINGDSRSEIKNVSVFQAGEGVFEKSFVTGAVLKNTISIDNGGFDLNGQSEATYSDIGTLSTGASVDTNSTRLDPLYRDRENHDLRLGVVEAGFAFDSPAKEGGDDGNDMGAFAFFYGDTITTTTTVDFATAGYRNPDAVVREHAHVRLVEDSREDASLRSKSIGVKRLWSFEWNSPNDMSDAQRQDLIDLFELENSDMDVSFDGGSSWITVILKREDSILYQDEGGYVNDTLPLAVRRLVFREK